LGDARYASGKRRYGGDQRAGILLIDIYNDTVAVGKPEVAKAKLKFISPSIDQVRASKRTASVLSAR